MSDARAADRAAAERLVDVSRETWARLDTLVTTLDRWQAKTNLVAPNTLDEIWTRHIADSAQLVALAPPEPARWVDIGSGGGFPGLVVAAILSGTTDIHLVESNGKKAAFLREASRAMGVSANIHAERAEAALAGLSADVVTARALAPLTALLGIAAPLLKTGAVGLFPKGREASAELTEAEKSWRFRASFHPSLTDEIARIVRVEAFEGPAG